MFARHFRRDGGTAKLSRGQIADEAGLFESVRGLRILQWHGWITSKRDGKLAVYAPVTAPPAALPKVRVSRPH